VTAFSAFLQQPKKIRTKMRPSLKERNLLLDLLSVFFGISAWISINGVWVELPLLVQVTVFFAPDK
jgi:hypothetical protein